MKPENIVRKCLGCRHLKEVAGGPDHGDIRCTNEKSSSYDHRILEYLRTGEMAERVTGCEQRSGRGRKTIVITGASKGIGEAIAYEFAGRHGKADPMKDISYGTESMHFDLALISRHYNELEPIAERLMDLYEGFCLPFECDVGDRDRVRRVFENIYKQFGSVDVLVNNSGFNSRMAPNANDPGGWLDAFGANMTGWVEELATNLTGAYMCSYLAAGYMLKQGGGSIINISSVKGVEPTSSPGYGASKAGVIKLTRDFAKALAPHGIRVNCVAPGFIDTGMTSELPEDKKTAYRKLIPSGRFGNPEEVAKVVSFLASDAASYITGETIHVNGGYLMV